MDSHIGYVKRKGTCVRCKKAKEDSNIQAGETARGGFFFFFFSSVATRRLVLDSRHRQVPHQVPLAVLCAEEWPGAFSCCLFSGVS